MAFNLTLRKAFLYIFASVGLVLTIIGTVSLINLGLRSYVFTKSDYPCYYEKPYPATDMPKNPDGTPMSQAEIDRRNKEAEQRCMDSRVSDKQRQAANAIAMLIVGLPLYGYHWAVIRKENQI